MNDSFAAQPPWEGPWRRRSARSAGARMGRDDSGHGWGGPGRGHGDWGHFGRQGFGFLFPGFPFDPRGGRRGGARRGDVRAAALALLAEEPMHGYQIIQEITQRSHGAWRPSPGSVYPALQQLEDEGLVRVGQQGGRKVYELTDEGRTYVAEHQDEVTAPWDAVSGSFPTAAFDAKAQLAQIAMAYMQVLHTGDKALIERAGQQLADTRRALYRLLADEETE